MSYKKQTELALIVEGLDWCSKFKGYSNLTSVNDHNNQMALRYNNAWIRLIRRIKDYTSTGENLIRVYVGLKQTKRFDPELKDIILTLLKQQGYNQGLLYMTPAGEIEIMLETGNFNFNNEQLDIN